MDCGCNDGEKSIEVAQAMGASNIHGIEVIDYFAKKAEGRGITVTRADLNKELPFPENNFNVIISLEVIEHLHRPETFVKELYRLLRPGGYAIIATENLASWHNIFALLWGWQPFTLSQFSEKKSAIGNPWGLDRGENTNPALKYPSYRHCLVLSYRGIKELFEIHGFTIENFLGSGYYPLPPLPARFMSACDPRHSAFLTIKIRKPS